MKHFFKLFGSLLADQFIGCISGFMLILCVSTFFKNSLSGYVLAFIICFGFYAYVTYNSAFKSGFHDHHRTIKDTRYSGYLYKGASAGALSATPIMILYIIYKITGSGILGVYYMVANMYWTWPMINIFPNHQPLVMPLVVLPVVIIPWIGYIAGYHNFLITDHLVNLYQKFNEQK